MSPNPTRKTPLEEAFDALLEDHPASQQVLKFELREQPDGTWLRVPVAGEAHSVLDGDLISRMHVAASPIEPVFACGHSRATAQEGGRCDVCRGRTCTQAGCLVHCNTSVGGCGRAACPQHQRTLATPTGPVGPLCTACALQLSIGGSGFSLPLQAAYWTHGSCGEWHSGPCRTQQIYLPRPSTSSSESILFDRPLALALTPRVGLLPGPAPTTKGT